MLEVNVCRKNQGGDFLLKVFLKKLLYFLQTDVVTPRQGVFTFFFPVFIMNAKLYPIT